MPEENRPASQRFFLNLLSVGVVGACLLMRFNTAGWFIIPGAAIYISLGGLHIYFQWKASKGWQDNMIVASHALLVTAFLLQWDQRDGPEYLTITALLGDRSLPVFWPSGPVNMLINFALFLPVIWTWRRLRRTQENLETLGL